MSAAPRPPVRVGLWVESLMGYGHALRALQLLRAVRPEAATVLSASVPASRLLTSRAGDAVLVDLPPVRVDDLRRPLPAVGSNGLPLAGTMAHRVELGWRALAALEPTHLVLEHFPFGRLPLLPEVAELVRRTRAAFPACRVLCSVRDIPRGARLTNRQARIVHRFLRGAVDTVLVHGDRRLFDLELLLPESHPRIDVPLVYTGYVRTPQSYSWREEGACVIDVGGGWSGTTLLRDVLRWAADALPDTPLCVVAGTHCRDQSELVAAHPAPVRMVSDAEKGDGWTLNASLCIGRLGYNMGVEMLTCRVPFVAVPHWGAPEQRLRAEIFGALGRAAIVSEHDIAQRPEVLHGAVADARRLASGWLPELVSACIATEQSLAELFVPMSPATSRSAHA